VALSLCLGKTGGGGYSYRKASTNIGLSTHSTLWEVRTVYRILVETLDVKRLLQMPASR